MSVRRGFVGTVVAVGALAVAGACSGGLKVEEGNAFPCDYARADVRDTACAPGWRCGIDSRCHEDVPEALADAPALRSSAPARVYPKQLGDEARFVAVDPREGRVLVGYENDALFFTNGFSARSVQGSPLARAAFVGGQVALHVDIRGLEGQRNEGLALGTLESGATGFSVTGIRPVLENERPRALRAVTQPDGGASLLVLRSGNRAGEVDLATGGFTSFPGGFTAQADGGVCVAGSPLPGCPADSALLPILDARPVPLSALTLRRGEQGADALVPVVVTRDFFFWRRPGSTPGADTWQVINPDDPVSREGGSAEGEWLLRHGEDATVWALRRHVRESPTRTREVLSTWTLQRTAQGPRMERAWDDCSPCGAGRLVTFTPVSDGALGVEALCESALGTRSLFRIAGASVTSPLDACLRQPLEAPVDLAEIASTGTGPGRRVKPGAVDEAHGAGLALGGVHGQLWVGRTLSTLRPLFLDRVPLDVASLEVPGAGRSFLALTPDYVALRFPPGGRAGPGEPEGLTAVDPRQADGGAAEQARLATLVKGVQGWLVLESGQLVRVSPADGTLGNSYGPQLLAPNGSPATGPYLGQGLPASGAETGASLVLTANDQLYVLDSAKLEAEPGAQPGLLPRLTPDPGFPIRSLARDRTVSVSSTTGPRVRGWLSTGRSLFEYQQSAEGQWSVVPLPLGDAEPVEVWGREGDGTSYGRVGLRDGQVLRLPSGVPLTQPLLDSDIVDFVVDYASPGGSPVALGEKGLYVARPSNAGPSKLLAWEPLTEAFSADALKGARIEVVPEAATEALYLFTRTGGVYRLAEVAR